MALVLGLALSGVAVALSQVAASRGWLHSSGSLHVWYHLTLFAGFGGLILCASARPATRMCWLAAAVLLGLGMEYGEAVRYHGTLEWADVGNDAVGVVWGAAAGWLLARRMRRAN